MLPVLQGRIESEAAAPIKVGKRPIRPEKQKMPPDAPAVSGGPHGVKSRALNSPAEQAKDLGETTTKAMMDSAKIPTRGGLSS